MTSHEVYLLTKLGKGGGNSLLEKITAQTDNVQAYL